VSDIPVTDSGQIPDGSTAVDLTAAPEVAAAEIPAELLAQ